MVHLARYDGILEKINALDDKFETGDMTAEGFLRAAIPLSNEMELSHRKLPAKEYPNGTSLLYRYNVYPDG